VPTFAYATCLWWDFLGTRLGTGTLVALQEALERDGEARDTLAEMETAIQGAGGDLATEWSTFARWNLATKFRAGAMESYGYAEEIGPIAIAGTGATFAEDNRFYPLAASYYQLDHPGGDLWFSHDDDASGVIFSLHPASGEAGPVEPALLEWAPAAPASTLLAEDLAPGIYWLVGAHAAIAENSAHFGFCLGDAATAELCLARPDTGGDDTGGPGDTAEEPGGCGCAGIPAAAGWLVPLLAARALRRRRGR